jgi:lipopolysaccharide assembly protein A
MAGPSAQIPGPETPQKKDERRPAGERARTVAMVVLAVLITLFAVLNSHEVKVDWIFGSDRAPLIVVVVISLLVGIVLTYFAERRGRKRR